MSGTGFFAEGDPEQAGQGTAPDYFPEKEDSCVWGPRPGLISGSNVIVIMVGSIYWDRLPKN